jgi:tetratricopeptide (TPR) repeat protein
VDSELPAVVLAQGYYYYHGLEDYDRALEEFLIAAESLPNESMVSNALGLVYRRLGRWEDAISAFEKAGELDPKSYGPKSNLGDVLAVQKRFAEAERMYEQALMIAPDVVDTYRWNAWNLLYWKGAIQEARKFLKRCPKQDHFYMVSTQAWCDYYDRNYEGVLAHLEGRVFDNLTFEARRQLLLGCAYRRLNQQEAARRALESVAEIQELQLENLPEGPRSRNLDMVELALAYALLERKDDAIHMAQLGVDLNAHDAFEGPGWLALLAWVHVFSGENDMALKLMEKLLDTPHAYSVPYAWSITAAVLRYHPDLDPLRDHSRFKDLLRRINGQE